MGDAIDCYFQFAFDDLPNLFLRVEMRMDRRACFEFVMRECHAGRIEEAAVPTGEAFDSRRVASINGISTTGRSAELPRDALVSIPFWSG